MPDRLTPTSEQLVEDALRSHPVSPMPRSLTGDVLARIRETPAPRFQFTPNDYLLTLVLTVVFSSIIFSLGFLPEHVLLQLRIQGILLWQSFLVNARWLVPALFFGTASILAALTIPPLYRMTMDHRR